MKTSPDSRNALLLCCLILFTCLLCDPFVEMGVNDDWSYIKTAQDLARTGHFVYNGWAAAMIGAQAIWGALFALIFGTGSFTAVRLSVIPLALGTVALFYALCRRSGVQPSPALFGALTLGLSPMFVPFAVTFMTEVPGLFLVILCVYAYTRAAEEQEHVLQSVTNPNGFDKWLAVAVVAGVASGTVRQTGWIIPVLAAVLLARDAWGSDASSPRKNRVLITHLLALAASVGFAVLANEWFSHQPYAVHEQTGVAVSEFLRTGRERFDGWKILPAAVAYTLVLLAMPLFPLVGTVFLPRKRLNVPLLGFALTVGLLLASQWLFQYLPPRRIFPWIQNTVTETELWWYLIPGDIKHFPVLLAKPARVVLSCLVIGLTTLLGTAALLDRVYSRIRAEKPPPDASAPFAARLFKLFALVYVPLLVIKLFVPYSFGVLDRYLLTLVPGLILWLLCRRDQTPEPSRPACVASALILAVFAYYSIGRTHDCFAQRRAVVELAGRLTHVGIPRNLVSGGFEYNGWTQIEAGGYYNDPRLLYPVGAYHPPVANANFHHTPLGQYSPRVKGVFFIFASQFPDLSDTATRPVPYDCWLPPFRRSVYLQTSDARFKGFAAPDAP